MADLIFEETWSLRDEDMGRAHAGSLDLYEAPMPRLAREWRAAEPDDLELANHDDAQRPRHGLSTSTFETPRKPVDILPVLRRSEPTSGFEALRSWEGTVERVEADTFLAVLKDLTDPEAPSLVADLPIDDISDDDAPLLREGAVFYWTIGHHSSLPGGRGQRRRVSVLRFRRLPPVPIDEAKVTQRVAELEELFASGDDDLAGA